MSLLGCALKQMPEMKSGPLDSLNIDSKNITSQISQLEGQLKDQSQATDDPAVLFHLALLYSSPNNPSPDHGKALKRIQTYMKKIPDEKKNNFERYILALLLEIDSQKTKCIKCNNRVKGLKKSTQKLKETCDELFEENQQMKQINEKLKNLDIRLEKKRKSID
ncbi:MAG: hypothetical protein KJ658_14780 [Proteobacteria bacterium]|nr:hypothetical protein [Pseudomonadota bacterium]